MKRNPINLLTYFIGIIVGSYVVNTQTLTALIISIVFFFHAFMSGDTIDDRKTS